MTSKILVLEDEENFCLLIQDVLEDNDYQVQIAHHPEKAIELSQWNEFDLLIADVRMAGHTDGIGAAEAIRKLQPNMYSIIMTGYADDEAPPRAMNLGVDYYLYKPFNLEKLLNVAESVLQTQRDHSTYQHKLSNIYSGARRFLNFLRKEESDVGDYTLDKARLSFHKAYYAGMQAANLTATGALSIWAGLLPLEAQYENLQQIMGPEADALAKDYRKLQETAESYARSRSMGGGGQKGGVPMLAFSPLYTRVKETAVTFAQYIMASSVWFWIQNRKNNIRYQQQDLSEEAWLLFGVRTEKS